VDKAALDTYFNDRADRDVFSGTVRITQSGNELFAGAYGLANRSWQVPSTLDTRYDTASVTKLFTAVLVLQAVEEGLISLETGAVAYLGLEGTSIHPGVTLGHLITHTSGIGDDAEEEDGEDYADLWLERTSYLVRETEDLLAQFVDKPANFAPGAGCRYNNVGFILAGLMVEKAVGGSYRDLVEQRVFSRAGMTDSGFFSMDIVEERVAEGADLVNGRWRRNIYSYPPIGDPAGGAYCTITDLGRFMDGARRGELLGEEMTARFFRPATFHSGDAAGHSGDAAGKLLYGYGLEHSFDQSGHLMFYEKEGINAGTSAVIRHYPDSGTTIAILSNMEVGVWEPREHLHRQIWESSP
jgi:CubicO group peptidase (beta-lactamase class C family)